MPLYEYRCTACNTRFTRTEPMSEHVARSRPDCPKCHAPYLLEKETKREGHIEYCNNPECDYRAPIGGGARAANE